MLDLLRRPPSRALSHIHRRRRPRLTGMTGCQMQMTEASYQKRRGMTGSERICYQIIPDDVIASPHGQNPREFLPESPTSTRAREHLETSQLPPLAVSIAKSFAKRNGFQFGSDEDEFPTINGHGYKRMHQHEGNFMSTARHFQDQIFTQRPFDREQGGFEYERRKHSEQI